MVRDPVSRLESDWKMRRHEGWTPASINDAVSKQPELINASLYWQAVLVYRDRFPDHQIKIVFLEDFANDPRTALRECFNFIGVDPNYSAEIELGRRKNDTAGLRNVSPVVRWLVYSRWWHSFRDMVPLRLRTIGKLIFSKARDHLIEWDEVLLASVVEEMKEDAFRFLDFYGKPRDFWDFESQTGPDE